MPLRLTAGYLKRFANERLRRNQGLQQDLRTLLGVPDARGLFDLQQSPPVIDRLMPELHQAISAGRRILAAQEPPDSNLATYERFCICIYAAVLTAYFEALSEYLPSLAALPNETESVVAPGAPESPRDLKETVKIASKLAEDLSDVELPYIIGGSPDDVGATLCIAYSRWICTLLEVHRIKRAYIASLSDHVGKEARSRFVTWLAGDGEIANWLRTYLLIQQQKNAEQAVLDSLASVRDSLAGWTMGTSPAARRKTAWDKYRSFLMDLPDAKGTMFAEDFGVRKVFVQPIASYQIAGSKARCKERIYDIGGLIGALISTRTPGDELILLCGGPGSGKSTFCRILASELAKEESIHPVFLRLRRLREGADIPSFIEENLQKEGIVDRISELRDIPNLVLILDGFDELVMASRTRLREFFNNLREDLSSGALRNAKAIVSGRDTLFPGGMGLPSGSHAIYLQPFDRARIEAWGEKWRVLHQEQEGAQFHPELFFDPKKTTAGRRTPPLHHLVSWPLTLHLVARVDNAGALRISSGSAQDVEKASLYRSILAETAQRQLEQAQGQGRLSDIEMRRFLRAVAWEMYSTSRDSLEYSEVDPILSRFFPTRNELERAELADVAIVNAPEFTKGEEKGFEFVHKSFSEFLVAERIAETLEKVAYKVPDLETKLTWRMTPEEAIAAFAADLAIRLLPAEIQEMMEPMLADFRSFSLGTKVDDVSATEGARAGLQNKIDRLQSFVVSLGAGQCTGDIDRATKGSSILRTPLEPYSHFAVGVLAVLSALVARLQRLSDKKSPGTRAQIARSDLWRLIHLIEAGGTSIDRPLAARLFSGLEVTRREGETEDILYPPISPAALEEINGLAFPVVGALRSILSQNQLLFIENVINSALISTLAGRHASRNLINYPGMGRRRYPHWDTDRLPRILYAAGLISQTPILSRESDDLAERIYNNARALLEALSGRLSDNVMHELRMVIDRATMIGVASDLYSEQTLLKVRLVMENLAERLARERTVRKASKAEPSVQPKPERDHSSPPNASPKRSD